MELQKISVEIDPDIYTKLKMDVFKRRTTMSATIRQMLTERYHKPEHPSGSAIDHLIGGTE